MIAAMPQRPDPGRPRPVADPVVGVLAGRADEVARGWLIALLGSRPLAQAAALPVPEMAAAGPSLCRAVLEAVGSDPALDALAAGGHAEDFASLAGSEGGPAVVAAAEALRRAVLEAADAELSRADSAVVADLSDRLAHVCARLAADAMALVSGESAAGHEPPSSPVELVPSPSAETGAAASPPGAAPPLWLAALERRLADGGSFALMLVELDGVEQVQLAEGEDAARDLFERAGRGVRGALRRPDLLAQEPDGRMWVIAAEAGRPGAAALAERIAEAVERAASARGVPLTTSIGVAMFPDDGRDVDELTAQAEESALGARASGIRVGGGPDDRPAAQGPRLVP